MSEHANPETTAPQHTKTLEMRVAELEDKLSKVHITEEEMKAYHKVAALVGGGRAAPTSPALIPQVCTIRSCVVAIRVACQMCLTCSHCNTECSECVQQTGGIGGGIGGGFGGLGG